MSSSPLPQAEEFRRDLRSVIRDELGQSGDQEKHVLVHAWTSEIEEFDSTTNWIRNNFRAKNLNSYTLIDLSDLYDEYDIADIDIAQKVAQTTDTILLICSQDDYNQEASAITQRVVRDFTPSGTQDSALQDRVNYFVEQGIGGLPQSSEDDVVAGFHPQTVDSQTPNRPPTYQTHHDLFKKAGSKIAAYFRSGGASVSTPGVRFESED